MCPVAGTNPSCRRAADTAKPRAWNVATTSSRSRSGGSLKGLGALCVPGRSHRTGSVDALDSEVDPSREERIEDRVSVGFEVVDQVDDLVTEGHIEIRPAF